MMRFARFCKWNCVVFFSAIFQVVARGDAINESGLCGKPPEHWIATIETNKGPAQIEAVVELGYLGRRAAPGVLPLCVLLNDGDPSVIHAAIEALGRIGAEANSAVPLLAAKLGDPRFFKHKMITGPTGSSVSDALARIGKPAVPALIALLQSKDKSTRILATEALGQIGPSAVDAVPFLLPELQGDTRVWVADALGLMGQKDEALVSAINNALTSKNSDDTMVRSCVNALSKLRVPPVNTFLEAIKNEDSERMTLLATRGPGVKAAVPALIKALRNQSFDVRHAAVTALGIIGPDASSSVPILVEMLDSKDTDRSVPNFVERLDAKGTDRSKIILALSRIGPLANAAIPSLLKLLEQPDTPDPSLIVETLSEIDPDGNRILNPLVRALDPNHPLVRERGAEFRQEICLAFGRIGPLAQSAVPVLIATLGKDEQRLVQIEAAMALSRIGPSARLAVPALTKALRDDDAGVRVTAALALGRIGSASIEALPTLRSMLGQTKQGAREIIQALIRIDPAESKFVRDILTKRPLLITTPYDRAVVSATLGMTCPQLEVIAKEQYLAIRSTLESWSRKEDTEWVNIAQEYFESLGDLGPTVMRACPEIKGFLHHPNAHIRKWCKIVLNRIEP